MEKKEIRIFYSWQSTLNEKTNKRFIRDILHKAIDKLEEDLSINITLDEATRDEAGSPNIPQTIIEKILKADIFIADVSIVHMNTDHKKGGIPNPNVMYELGFAVAQLGWSRVLLTLNEAFGPVEYLPFDISKHRVSLVYSLNTEEEEKDKAKKKRILEDKPNSLFASIKCIVDQNPIKGVFGTEQLTEITKRERDIKNIKWFLSGIQIETFDLFMQELPKTIIYDIFQYYDILSHISQSSKFHLYNTELFDLIVEFCYAFSITLSYDKYYHSNLDNSLLIWKNHLHRPLTPKEQADSDNIEKHVGIMRKTLRNILDILRKDYLEIDVAAISRHNFEQSKKE